MTDTPADEGTAHQGQAITDVPTGEQPTVFASTSPTRGGNGRLRWRGNRTD